MTAPQPPAPIDELLRALRNETRAYHRMRPPNHGPSVDAIDAVAAAEQAIRTAFSGQAEEISRLRGELARIRERLDEIAEVPSYSIDQADAFYDAIARVDRLRDSLHPPTGTTGACRCGHDQGSHNSLTFNCLATTDGTHATRCPCKAFSPTVLQ